MIDEPVNGKVHGLEEAQEVKEATKLMLGTSG